MIERPGPEEVAVNGSLWFMECTGKMYTCEVKLGVSEEDLDIQDVLVYVLATGMGTRLWHQSCEKDKYQIREEDA